MLTTGARGAREAGGRRSRGGPRVLYTLLANLREALLHGHERPPTATWCRLRGCSACTRGLAAPLSRLAALMVLLPLRCEAAHPGLPRHRSRQRAAAVPASLRLIGNNSLGSYGCTHAFATSRGRYDLYIFSRTTTPGGGELRRPAGRPVRQAFGAAAGCLAGVLQGRPVEPSSSFGAAPRHSLFVVTKPSSRLLLLTTVHVGPHRSPPSRELPRHAARALAKLFAHVYDERRWNGSTAALMDRLANEQRSDDGRPIAKSGTYYGNLQLGLQVRWALGALVSGPLRVKQPRPPRPHWWRARSQAPPPPGTNARLDGRPIARRTGTTSGSSIGGRDAWLRRAARACPLRARAMAV